MSGEDVKRSISLSQVQIIRSLADALAWFEKEISWGVDPAELRHLTGRIGELYAAMITRGQMALAVNQRGYDVVGADGQKISVKTVTSSGHVSFRKSTLIEANRIMILRINIDEGEASIEEIAEAPVSDIIARCVETAEGYRYGVRARPIDLPDISSLKVVADVTVGHRSIGQLENGTIIVEVDGARIPVAKPILREIASLHGISLLNSNGGVKNTRQLGADIIATLNG
jgi:hypothetical protein